MRAVVVLETESIGSGPSQPSSLNKGDSVASEGHRAGNKRQKQKQKETRKREGGHLSQEDKELPLGREDIGAAHSQMAVYKGKRNVCVSCPVFE